MPPVPSDAILFESNHNRRDEEIKTISKIVADANNAAESFIKACGRTEQESEEVMTSKVPHPMQPLVSDNGTIRFQQNSIVRFLLDSGPFDLNQLATMDFDDEDWNQFAQLLGSSVSGFCDLSYAKPSTVELADAMAGQWIRYHAHVESIRKSSIEKAQEKAS